MLNSTEHEICHVMSVKMPTIVGIFVKMSTIVGILTFINIINTIFVKLKARKVYIFSINFLVFMSS